MRDIELIFKENSFGYKEAFKSLRTNIIFCGSDIKVIAITSCMPNEGKTETSINIARTLAEDGRKVIYIDADLRKSVVKTRYKVGQKIVGFSHYLSGQNELSDVIYSTNVDNMDMIFAGIEPPNPAELLGNAFFTKAIETLKEKYDYVIVDTPPMGSVADCAVVSRNCDGVIMVIGVGDISFKFAKETKKQLEKTNCRILGVVLNKVQTTKRKYYSGYYGTSYYGYKRTKNYYSNEEIED